ncbi:4434_t:CDS:10 [Ambispora gerdemannii]|uniref:4434_t:CDS:1 n=1 Tax=Ambispora gerdemannii TaxID=144530 RepID=A0A9N9AHG0_9GLOM|nr:4434_t:CDS:10 [Ambispora gerdemannii]
MSSSVNGGIEHTKQEPQVQVKQKPADTHGRRYTYAIRKDLSGRQLNCFLVLGGLVYFLIFGFQLSVRVLGCWAHFTEENACDSSYIQPLYSINTIYSFLWIYLLGVLPTLLLRKWYRNSSETEENLWSDIRIHLSSTRTYATIMTYVITAMVIGRCYYKYLLPESFNRSLKLFLQPEVDFRCHPFRRESCKNDALNEYTMILAANTVGFGVWYALDYLIRKRFLLNFPSVQIPILQIRFELGWRSLLETLWQERYEHLQRLRSFTLSFPDVEVILLSNIIDCTTSQYTTYQSNSLLLGFYTYVLDFGALAIRELLYSGMLLWNEKLVDGFHTKKKIISSISNEVLVNGLNAKDEPYIQSLAFLELWHIAKDSKHLTRRTTIYQEFDKNTWTNISRVCIELILGLGYAANTQIQTQYKKNEQIRRWRAEINREQKNGGRGKATGGQKAKLIPLKDINTSAGSYIPRHSEYWDLVWFERLRMRGFGYHYFVFPLLNRTIERRSMNLLKDKNTIVLAVEALASLTIDSLTLDQYGVVSPDISKVFECMLDCLIALEEYAKKPPLYEWDSRTPSKAHSRVLADVVGITNGKFIFNRWEKKSNDVMSAGVDVDGVDASRVDEGGVDTDDVSYKFDFD